MLCGKGSQPFSAHKGEVKKMKGQKGNRNPKTDQKYYFAKQRIPKLAKKLLGDIEFVRKYERKVYGS